MHGCRSQMQGSLNAFMDMGKKVWRSARETVQNLLSKDNPSLRDNKQLRSLALVPQDKVCGARLAHYGGTCVFVVFVSFECVNPMQQSHRPPVANTQVQMLLPCRIGDYTDFYSSREHATNVGTMFRGKANALQPNWCVVAILQCITGHGTIRYLGTTSHELPLWHTNAT